MKVTGSQELEEHIDPELAAELRALATEVDESERAGVVNDYFHAIGSETLQVFREDGGCIEIGNSHGRIGHGKSGELARRIWLLVGSLVKRADEA